MSGRNSPTKPTPETPAHRSPGVSRLPGTPGTPVTPKAIGSLAKRQDDVTRQGTQKMKFVPTLPARRKKSDVEVKQEEASSGNLSSPGRGRGRGRGRGEGRGAVPRLPAVEMTASGPFAMGPSMAGSSARRSVPRSNFTPIVPLGLGGSAALGAGLSRTTAPSLKSEAEKDVDVRVEEDPEVYSDPDEGVEIVDMDDVRQMDWMAPESLRRDKEDGKKNSKFRKVKKEGVTETSRDKGKGKASDDRSRKDETEGVNLANALDLSESEEEEELEDLIEDFALQSDLQLEQDSDIRQERLYFFQFPRPFPTFVSKKSEPAQDVDMGPNISTDSPDDKGKRRVSFAADVKPPAPEPEVPVSPDVTMDEKGPAKLDGVIGQLEIYKSGAVKMRLGNGIVMDVSAATQPSFLQHAVHLDLSRKRLCVLGEVNRRFVVSPSIDALLADAEAADQFADLSIGEDGLLKMDTL